MSTRNGLQRAARNATRALPPAVAVALALASAALSQVGERMLRSDVAGPGWTADSLANLEIGMNRGRSVSYRFRADHDGAATAVCVYFIFRRVCPKGCYAAGDGGKIRVELRDDGGPPNHAPGAAVLASALVTDPMRQWSRLVTFDPPARLSAGQLYHLVFSNVAPDEVANYVSIDDLYTAQEGAELHPAAAALNLAVLLRADAVSAWEWKPHHLPIFALEYADGFRQGQGYIDVKQAGVAVSHDSRVREVFAAATGFAGIGEAGVRVKALSGGGTLRFTLATDAGRTLETAAAQVTIPTGQLGWVIVAFATQPPLERGEVYTLMFSGEQGGQYLIQPLQNGAQYGFEVEEPLAGNRCEASAGGDWQGCLNRTDLDVPFYLRITAGAQKAPGPRGRTPGEHPASAPRQR